MSEYIDKIVAELESQGIKAPDNNSQVPVIDNKDLQVITLLENASGRKFSDEQRKILEYHGNACILACAGSGKTTTSINLIAKRIMTGEIEDVGRLIYTTYSKAGATEMKERLDKLLRSVGMGHINVKVQTIHAFFLSVLKTFGCNAKVMTEAERAGYIKKACRDKEINFALKDDDLMVLNNLLSYQLNNLLNDNKAVSSYVNTLDNLDVKTYSKIRKKFLMLKDVDGKIDFDDMQLLLYNWIVKWANSSNTTEVEYAKKVKEYCKYVYTDFYIDEAQDVSKIQFEIIRAMVEDANNPGKLDKGLVFIGDDDQCIYEWRGSDPNIILGISSKFDMRTFVLSTNYRCKKEILDFASTGIKHNASRYLKNMGAFNNGGNVKIIQVHDKELDKLSNVALDHIKYLIKNNSPNDIAVLCRNNFHLSILSNLLLMEGIYCKSTDDMKLTKSYMYKSLKDVIDITEPTWKKDLTARVLWRLCRFLSSNNALSIAKFQNDCGLSLEDALGYIIKRFINTNINFNKRLGITLQAEASAEDLVNRLGKETREDIEIVYKAITCENRHDAIEALLFQYLIASSYLYKNPDKNRTLKGLVNYLKYLMNKMGTDGMLDFLKMTEQFENGNMVIPGDKVTLTTIHSAKGREWKHVIMFACDNLSEPNFNSITKMLKDGAPISYISSTIDEERRLFYVGNTRAIDTLTLITYDEPSVFILEALGAFGEPTNNNFKIIELAQDENWIENYKPFINDNIVDSKSKYYYDVTKYK